MTTLTRGALRRVWGNANEEENGFFCGEKKAKEITFSQYSAGGKVVGGWGGSEIIDCGETYWVLSRGDWGMGPLYGPIAK